jgi:hypothetical protein
MTSVSDSVQELFADRGTILATGPVVLPTYRGGTERGVAFEDSSSLVVHHVDSLTYMDNAGHLHGVLIDTVTTTGGSGTSTTLEILADVVITPPPG